MKTSIEYKRGCILEPDIIISLEVVLLPVGILLATSIDIYFSTYGHGAEKNSAPMRDVQYNMWSEIRLLQTSIKIIDPNQYPSIGPPIWHRLPDIRPIEVNNN